MTQLARRLTLWNYFALGFGAMIGTGWVVLMDDWLSRGGPLGGMLGFAIAGVLLLPVGYVYGQWVARLPDASGEAAYVAQVFPPWVSYFTGWIMLLAYLIVCPWEAVALGKLAAYIFPQLDTIHLYTVAGQPVFLPRLILGAAATLLLGYLNFRGIRGSAIFQTWATSAVIGIFLLLVLVSAGTGRPSNLQPLFSHAPLTSILLMLQIVPYFVTGFESVPKVAEEANPGFAKKDFFKAIAMALLVGAGFYVLAIGAAAYIAPWQSVASTRFATAVAFQEGTHSVLVVRVILAVSFVGLFQVFNGNFVAASRLIFAFARRGTMPRQLANVHAKYLSPNVAIWAVCVVSLIGLLLGDSLLVPITEVGSLASSTGWFAACVSFVLIEKNSRLRMIAILGMTVSALLMLMKLLPVIPGHFSTAEWIALAAWLLLGWLCHRRGGTAAS